MRGSVARYSKADHCVRKTLRKIRGRTESDTAQQLRTQNMRPHNAKAHNARTHNVTIVGRASARAEKP
jgi:hypothetical protein